LFFHLESTLKFKVNKIIGIFTYRLKKSDGLIKVFPIGIYRQDGMKKPNLHIEQLLSWKKKIRDIKPKIDKMIYP